MGQRNSERQGSGRSSQPKKEAAPGRQGQQSKPRQGGGGQRRPAE